MSVPRPFALMQTEDQWLRAFHEDTAIEAGVVQLAIVKDTVPNVECPQQQNAAGLAFDQQCRLYHSFPEQGRVERQLWDTSEPAEPFDLFTATSPQLSGDFHSVAVPDSALQEPRGLAVDFDNRLYIAESAAKRILIFDLWNRRLLHSIFVSGHPLDLEVKGNTVIAVLAAPAALVELETYKKPRPLQLPADVKNPSRVAVSPEGEIFVLDNACTKTAHVVCYTRPKIFEVYDLADDFAFASDIEFLPGPILVIARRPNQDFLQFRIGTTTIEEMPPLKARDYDGQGIVRTPDDRIGFFTSHGFRHAVAARVRYKLSGRVITYQLDSGEFRTVWGRLFLDACIPQDTNIRVACVATDDPPEDEETLPRRLPDNVTEATIFRPDLSPPMLPLSLVPANINWLLHRREAGRELPFTPYAQNDLFQTYEAPILTSPGRYLWVALELTGNTRFTPKLRSLRAEYPAHNYLRRLPKIFSREEQLLSLLGLQDSGQEELQQLPSKVFSQNEQPPSFLHRYLAIFDGFMNELDGPATTRHVLLDPAATHAEVLDWLAGFVGLVLDERWPVPVQRAILAQAAWLFRFRGTVPGITRFLEIYTGSQVFLIEKFRLRGLGNLGEPGGPESRAILGAGFRVGGAIAQQDFNPLSGSVEDAFDTHAHRFSAIIPAVLSAEQLDVVRHILDVHRPAHTLVDICTVDAGIRVGQRLHVGLTSIIGRSGGFSTLQAGSSLLGRGSIIGRPGAGTRLEGSRLGKDSRVG
ncbi:phage tail protein [Methyloglobulus sp.]|uniref:phage tail protein n=1 Tax=Methyloglobulus sp. TaxID=2518622 RepID=UPI0032B7C10B